MLFSTLFTFINALCYYSFHNTPYVSDKRKEYISFTIFMVNFFLGFLTHLCIFFVYYRSNVVISKISIFHCLGLRGLDLKTGHIIHQCDFI